MFHAYSDESGDEGKNGKRWFINTAIVVNDKDEILVRKYEDELKQIIYRDNGLDPPKYFHWNEISNYSVRCMISKHLGQKPYTSISVCIDKYALPTINNMKLFYEFTCILLIERVSWYVDHFGGKFDMIFSKRGGITASKIQECVIDELSFPECQIRPIFNIKDIKVKPMENYIMLRVADNNASALGNAINTNQYGALVPDYFVNMSDRIYRYKNWNRKWKYGIKVYPCAIGKQGYEDFIKDYPHAEEWFK